MILWARDGGWFWLGGSHLGLTGGCRQLTHHLGLVVSDGLRHVQQVMLAAG